MTHQIAKPAVPSIVEREMEFNIVERIPIKSAKQLQRFRLRGGESVREGARAQMSRIAGCDNSASAG